MSTIPKKTLFLFLIFVIHTGCAHHVVINSNITPNAITIKKFDKTAAVVFSDEMLTYVAHTKPSTYVGAAHTYDFEIGSALVNALSRSVEVSYSNTLVVESTVLPGQYDCIIKFNVQSCDIDIEFQQGFWSARAKANCMIAVQMEAYEGKEVSLLKKVAVSGAGFSSHATHNAFSSEEHFAVAVRKAIQHLSDNVANLILSRFAEPT